ncbi:MAG: phytochelatin synthase family protein [Pseudomonadota bacterium]
MKKWIKWAGVLSLLIVGAFVALIAFSLTPKEDRRPLPALLVAVDSIEGQQLLKDAEAYADYEALATNFEPQQLTSFCGAASSTIVLNALGQDVSQTSLFDDKASEVRSIWRVALQGMTLQILADILKSQGAKVSAIYAHSSSIEAFRESVVRNLSDQGDYMLVNYQREALGQESVGHISPIAAYDSETDRALILDTAAYKYPHTWVPLDQLFDGMTRIDGESEISRGWIEVSGQGPSV